MFQSLLLARYEVYFGNLNVYKGNDYAEAVRITNFWDERGDTWLVDNEAGTPLEWAHRQFDAATHYIRSL